MKYLQRFILILLSYFSLFMFFNAELAYSSFSAYENQIFEESSEVKVRKLQEVFSGLWLYNWVIDWNYKSIEWNLLDYQKRAWIIIEDDDHWAWYFWNKTIEALEKEYWEKFLQLKETYLKIEKPSLDERYFYVTAYYSPVPWQQKYTTWSYEWDVRLNWEWKHTASWKEVFSWLMAAPRNYAFGTKIYLEWMWIWSVEDRWWAIVNAWERWHEYDRIDVWMWYWDEWLQRALKWWTRKIKWYVVDNNQQITIEFDESPITKYRWLVVDAKEPEDNSVKKLQELLKETWLYTWVADWDYLKVKNILIKYQLDSWVIDSEYDEEAGYFWEKTYAVFRKNFWLSWDWIFIAKYIEAWAYSELSLLEKAKIDAMKAKLELLLEKKYKWDDLKINKFKKSLALSIEKSVKSINNQKKKSELIYFRDIL